MVSVLLPNGVSSFFRIVRVSRKDELQKLSMADRINQLHHKLAVWLSYSRNYADIRNRIAQAHRCSPPRRVVVISQVVHLGDIVACEPVVWHVRRNQPDAYIVWALEKTYRELADSHPEVDYTLALECVSEWIRFCKSGLFDEVIDLNIYGRTCPVCRISLRKLDGSRGVTISNYYDFSSLLAAFAAGDKVAPLLAYADVHFITGGEEMQMAERRVEEYVNGGF